MLGLIDSQSLTSIGRSGEHRIPTSSSPRSKRKLYGRVSEVTIFGRTLCFAGPLSIVFGLPLLLIGVGVVTSLFGVLICDLERRAVTRY